MQFIRRGILRKSSIDITNWFHTYDEDGIFPAMTIQCVSDIFLDILQEKKLHFSVSTSQFRKIVCEAVCSLKHAQQWNLTLKGPNRQIKKPCGWNDEFELYWNEWLYNRVFTEDFWISFWKRIPISSWEFRLPGWRTFIESILPFYVLRNTDILVFEGYIVEDDNGALTAMDEWDSYDDTYI
jgi:hypothetical protein